MLPRSFVHPILRVILLSGLACVSMGRASAADPMYSRGYIDALMDNRFPGLGLRVQAIDAERVTLSTRICLGPWQKRDIASLLKETRSIDVVWAEPVDCSLTESEQAASATPDSTAKEISKVEAIPDTYALPEQVLFAPLIADPRQPRFSLSYQRYKIADQKFSAANVAFGEYFALAGILGLPGNPRSAYRGGVRAFQPRCTVVGSGQRGLLDRHSGDLSQRPVVVSRAAVSSKLAFGRRVHPQ